MLYRKFYKCSECGHEWEDIWDCLCNDRCPICNAEIEPHDWEEVEETAPAASKQQKLERLAEIEGLDVMEMLQGCLCDSVAPGICTNDGCSYSTEVEPDARGGYCEECGTQSVASCLMLAGMI